MLWLILGGFVFLMWCFALAGLYLAQRETRRYRARLKAEKEQ